MEGCVIRWRNKYNRKKYMTVRFSVILFLMMTFIKGEATGSKIKFSLSSKAFFFGITIITFP